MAGPDYEAPCDDGGACEWQSEEWYGDDGEMDAWDNFCIKCGRWRDWTKEERPEAVVATLLVSNG